MPGPRIGELLVGRGLVSTRDLEAALALQAEADGLLGLLLVRMGAVSEGELLAMLSEQLGLPVLAPPAAPSPERVAETIASSGVRVDWWSDHQAIVWRAEASEALHCASAHPLDPALADVLERLSEHPAEVHLAPRALIEELLARAPRQAEAVNVGPGALDAARLRELAQETPVVDFVNGLFATALARRASDVHIEPFEGEFLVRMRVDGLLTTVRSGPRAEFDAVCSRIKLISGMDIGERRLPQDGRQSMRVSGQDLDLRVSTLPSTWGESLVLRLLGKSNRLPELTELGLDSERASGLERLAEAPNGVLLVTGPTGSGKTTTIYRLLTHLNDGVRKIVTVEDPVEFDLPGVVQVQVRGDIGLSFAAGLRSILRQDPDVIMIGEIRDGETARIAIQAALTGHLVISTAHTNSALAAAARLMDLGAEPFLLADVLRGLVGQRLVRRLCDACARPSTPGERAAHEASRPRSLSSPGVGWREPVGCERCGGGGFRGRTGLFEIVRGGPTLAQAVRRRASEEELRALADAEGEADLYADGWLKASEGLTTLAELRRVMGLKAEAPRADAA